MKKQIIRDSGCPHHDPIHQELKEPYTGSKEDLVSVYIKDAGDADFRICCYGYVHFVTVDTVYLYEGED